MNPSAPADRIGRTVVRIDRRTDRATNGGLLDGLSESLSIDGQPKGVIVDVPGDDRVIVRWAASGATEDLPVGSVLEVWWCENLATWVTLPDE